VFGNVATIEVVDVVDFNVETSAFRRTILHPVAAPSHISLSLPG